MRVNLEKLIRANKNTIEILQELIQSPQMPCFLGSWGIFVEFFALIYLEKNIVLIYNCLLGVKTQKYYSNIYFWRSIWKNKES